MHMPPEISFHPVSRAAITDAEGRLGVLIDAGAGLDAAARRADRAMKGALSRLLESDAFARLDPGQTLSLAAPAGLAAEAVVVTKLAGRPGDEAARRAGAALARAAGGQAMTILAGARPEAAEIALGYALGAYRFSAYLTSPEAARPLAGAARMLVTRPERRAGEAARGAALSEGVWFARDLVNEPANILTTRDFADRLGAMEALGLEIELLDEAALEALGMRALLAVAQGSAQPARVVAMRWRGGEGPPVALVGKGVVFDTGGISIKPAQGMEAMIADMAGAAAVAGTMRALALSRAKADVIGLVGLVENMPDGAAQRPGDILRTMKGDTVEIISTDAEGRMVLADLLWHAAQHYRPAAIVDLATLTGAMVMALGAQRAGLFATNEALAGDLLAAADRAGEGLWRMPLDGAYDEALKSRRADVKNSGGREAGAVTAARFLSRFVPGGVPWAHLDIAGVADRKSARGVEPEGATGWGVRTLEAFIRARAGG